jgi:hypothetical protein
LEGVITLTNDVQKWGHWAGKIITGDEALVDQNNQPRPLIFAVESNGTVQSYAMGIHPEDFDLITSTQSLYCLNYYGGGGVDSRVLKIKSTWLTNFVGDLLITDAGEFSSPAKLHFVRWDASKSEFITRSLSLPDSLGGDFEHVTFAPINLPPVP